MSAETRHDRRSSTPYARGHEATRGGRMSTSVSAAEAAREQLGDAFGGEVIGADDGAFVIRFAREHDLPLAIKAGGHNGAGFGSVDDGVVADLSPLKDIAVD